jgi:hypothetical protein
MSWSTFLFKEFEDEETVIYKFGAKYEGEGDKMGKIQLNKKTEIVTELTPYTGENGGANFRFNQAGYCIAKCYRENKYADRVSRCI